jgi:hypothetical protein
MAAALRPAQVTVARRSARQEDGGNRRPVCSAAPHTPPELVSHVTIPRPKAHGLLCHEETSTILHRRDGKERREDEEEGEGCPACRLPLGSEETRARYAGAPQQAQPFTRHIASPRQPPPRYASSPALPERREVRSREIAQREKEPARAARLSECTAQSRHRHMPGDVSCPAASLIQIFAVSSIEHSSRRRPGDYSVPARTQHAAYPPATQPAVPAAQPRYGV